MGMAGAAHGQGVLFGGWRGKILGDTWTWNGSHWAKASPAHSPPPRAAMGLAYDAAREQVVLFGGYARGILFGDTWTWDGSDWTQRTPAHAPSPRRGMGWHTTLPVVGSSCSAAPEAAC